MSRSNATELKRRINKIAEELEDGKTNAELVKEYTVTWKVSESAIIRYISFAQDIVMKNMNDADAIIEAVRGEAIAEAAQEKLRSNLELEAKLVSIMEGEPELEKVISKENGVTEIKTKARRSEVIKIVELIWKHRGVLKKQSVQETGINKYPAPIIRVESEADREIIERIANLP